jgi:hypothetical protein
MTSVCRTSRHKPRRTGWAEVRVAGNLLHPPPHHTRSDGCSGGIKVTTFDNAAPLADWSVPVAKWCTQLLGEECDSCPEHYAHPMPLLDGRGDN